MPALRPYQIAGRDFLKARRRALLADEMRVGKTPQAIAAAADLGARRVLVLCPAIAVPQWQHEIRTWAPDIGAAWRVLSYDKARMAYYAENSSLATERFDVLIADEAHFCRNPTAQRTRMLYGRGGLARRAEYCWALTGTPAPANVANLWPMLRAFDATPLSYTDFVKQYCVAYFDQRYKQWRILHSRAERMPEIQAMLAPFMLRRTRRDVAGELSPVTWNIVHVAPAERAPQLALPETEDVAAWLAEHAAAYKNERAQLACAKAGPAAELIGEALREAEIPCALVFGWHTHALQLMAERLTKQGVTCGLLTGATPAAERQRLTNAFRASKIKVLLANLLAAGTAIDLSVANQVYWLEQDWVPANNVQAASRVISLAKTDPVVHDVFAWTGTLDDRVQQVLTRRTIALTGLL